MLSCFHACIVSFLVSAKTFMFIRMRNSIMRSVSLFYFPPSSPFLWINSSIWCVVQLNRCFCYHSELSCWVKGGDRVGITCLRVGNWQPLHLEAMLKSLCSWKSLSLTLCLGILVYIPFHWNLALICSFFPCVFCLSLFRTPLTFVGDISQMLTFFWAKFYFWSFG